MLNKYKLNGEELDSVDLKAMIISKGVKVSNKIYDKFSETHRINPNPLTCNCIILPDNTIAQLTDLAFHMSHLKDTISWSNLKKMKHASQMKTPFKLEVSSSGEPILLYNQEKVTPVTFPPKSQFYEQKTSSGLPYVGNAVLQGLDVVSFQCLWPYEYAKSGHACQFCYSGRETEQLARKKKPTPQIPTNRDVAEIVDYAINKEKIARHVQITGGSTFNTQAECKKIKGIIEEINAFAGLSNLQGELLVYTTPPSYPKEVDQLFDAGADRVICSVEVWDEELAKIVTPGKIKFTGRKRHLDCLKYIAKKYGPNKACSVLIVGIEPVDSFLKGAEYLASEGIVPCASVWIPFGRPVMGKMQAPNLDFYRKAKEGLASIYKEYGIEPPGGFGLNVCICRETWRHQYEIKDEKHSEQWADVIQKEAKDMSQIKSFKEALDLTLNENDKKFMKRGQLSILQVNLGNLCNQKCKHCHIDASPKGKKVMTRKTIDDVLHFLSQNKGLTLDVTGGAPELNPDFEYFIEKAKPLTKEIIVRSNLTVYFEQGKEHLPDFLAKKKVHLICSLPGYAKEKVDAQRGKGVFYKSIKALQIFNNLNYGKIEDLKLDLVTNPSDASLPERQLDLQLVYAEKLKEAFGVVFNRLLTVTNAPINRFEKQLKTNGEYEKYLKLLKDNFNLSTVEKMMCRTTLSVGYDGKLYDCDFNQALDLALKDEQGNYLSIGKLDASKLEGRDITFDNHCFTCTAGSGSSCQGALDVKKIVSFAYGKIAEGDNSFCNCGGTDLESSRRLSKSIGYSNEEMDVVPEANLGLGCGNPTALSKIREGDTVLDLGSGLGFDSFLAAKKVGKTGTVIGVDMTKKMIDKAKALASKYGYSNVQFRLGDIENLPVESETIDIVISNCVINLAPDKSKVFEEAYRVLKMGGRMYVSDIVLLGELSEQQKHDEKLLCGCVAGAVSKQDYLDKMNAVGFKVKILLEDKEISKKQYAGIPLESLNVEATK